jgi:hypothetical protein
MAVSDILATIDRDIAQLQRARTLLGGSTAATTKKSPGRPKKAVGRPKEAVSIVVPAAAKPAKKKRNLSPEGRKRIVAAMKRRWAAKKKAAEADVPATTKPAKKANKRSVLPKPSSCAGGRRRLLPRHPQSSRHPMLRT